MSILKRHFLLKLLKCIQDYNLLGEAKSNRWSNKRLTLLRSFLSVKKLNIEPEYIQPLLPFCKSAKHVDGGDGGRRRSDQSSDDRIIKVAIAMHCAVFRELSSQSMVFCTAFPHRNM